jgi:hypothetical protein
MALDPTTANGTDGGAIGEGAQVVAALHGFLGDMAKPVL